LPPHPKSARAAARIAAALLAAACSRESEPPSPAPEPPAPAPAPAAAPPPRPRGLWVLCEGSQRVLEHPERIPALIEDARALGATDLFVQVYRGGRAWFDSTLADPTPYRELRESTGRDTLADLLAAARAAGLRVHAWVNVLSLSGRRDVPILRDLGRDAVLVDQAGRSLLDYPELDVPPPDRRYYRMGTPAVWLDPAAPGVAERLAATFAELVARYPLDGLHLDYIRYPDVLPFSPGSRFGVGLDLGHGAPTRERFRRETGLEPPSPPDHLGNADAWDAWRRDRVTELVARIRAGAQAARPGIALSAAVWAYADRAYLSAGQDWRRWLEEGTLEFAVPMAYTLDARLFRYQAAELAQAARPERVWLGVGVWLFAKRPEAAVAQLRAGRDAGAGGDALFSWDAIADAPPLRAALAAEVLGKAAPGPAPTAASPPPMGPPPVGSAAPPRPEPPALPASPALPAPPAPRAP
jgi:uncharacterized lipoprotein YddW (UPF0748 family)